MNLWFLIYRVGSKEYYLTPTGDITLFMHLALKFTLKETAINHKTQGNYCFDLSVEQRESIENSSMIR